MRRGAEFRRHSHPLRAGGVAAATAALLFGSSAAAMAAPPIRSGASNPVPACATPDRLMAFLTARNPNLDPRFASIAKTYKQWGEAWRVRWDYAFFQMAIETNYLTYRRIDGRPGDVHETQNNFAGIGATGGGVPGDRFADVSTGVHAQIQHLVAYSGERLARPIAPRTILKQNDIVELSLRLDRPVTFGDLARRWAVDRNYARSIDFVAGQFRDAYCQRGGTAAAAGTVVPPAPQPARRRALPPPSGLGAPKPSALAGPQTEPAASEIVEVLPWATTTPAEAPKSIEAPTPAPSKKAASPSAVTGSRPAPVRTIWARKAKPAKAQDAAAAVVTAGTATAPQTAAPATGAIEPPAPAAGEGFFGMPLFRIAPAAPSPPSRLGGPIPVLNVPADADAALAADAPPCRVLKASYGGSKTLLVRSTIDGEVRLTALTVLDGFEKSMFETYARAAAPGADVIGEYADQDDALADARANCPNG